MSGESLLSKLFAHVVWDLIVVDEAHHTHHAITGAVVSKAKTAVIVYDEAQLTDAAKQNSERSEFAVCRAGDRFCWEQAACGSTMMLRVLLLTLLDCCSVAGYRC